MPHVTSKNISLIVGLVVRFTRLTANTGRVGHAALRTEVAGNASSATLAILLSRRASVTASGTRFWLGGAQRARETEGAGLTSIRRGEVVQSGERSGAASDGNWCTFGALQATRMWVSTDLLTEETRTRGSNIVLIT